MIGCCDSWIDNGGLCGWIEEDDNNDNEDNEDDVTKEAPVERRY